MWQPSQENIEYTTKTLAVCMNEYACVKEAERRVNETLSFFNHIKSIKTKAIKMEERLTVLNIQRNKRRSMEKIPSYYDHKMHWSKKLIIYIYFFRKQAK